MGRRRLVGDQGAGICLTVTADSTGVTSFRIPSIIDRCSPPSAWQWTRSLGAVSPIGSGLKFSYHFAGSLPSGDPATTNIQLDYSIAGTFTSTGTVTGTTSLASIAWDARAAPTTPAVASASAGTLRARNNGLSGRIHG